MRDECVREEPTFSLLQQNLVVQHSLDLLPRLHFEGERFVGAKQLEVASRERHHHFTRHLHHALTQVGAFEDGVAGLIDGNGQWHDPIHRAASGHAPMVGTNLGGGQRRDWVGQVRGGGVEGGLHETGSAGGRNWWQVLNVRGIRVLAAKHRTGINRFRLGIGIKRSLFESLLCGGRSGEQQG